MKLEHLLTSYTKINPKWAEDWNIRPETTKLFRGKHRQYTLWHNSQQDPFDPPPRVMEIKTKINLQDLIKLKSFGKAKKTINKWKDNPQNGRK